MNVTPEDKPPLSGYSETDPSVVDHFEGIEPIRSQRRDFPDQIGLGDGNFTLAFGLVTVVLFVAGILGYRVNVLNFIFVPVTLYLGREVRKEYKSNENRYRWSSYRKAVIGQIMALIVLFLALVFFLFRYLNIIPIFRDILA